MDDWKLKQEIYHRVYYTPAELHDPIQIHPPSLTISKVDEYFSRSLTGPLEYPSKSYAVAIIYAILLTKYFQVPIKQALSDPKLLYGNDPFFVPYAEDPDTYDVLIERWGNSDVESLDFAQVRATVEYFKQEFLFM